MSTWAVVGDGSWGAALAARLADVDNDVWLVGLEPSKRRWPKAIHHTTDARLAVSKAERVVLAVGIADIEPALKGLSPHLQGHHRVLTTARGLTPRTQLRASEAVQTLTAVHRIAVLAGAGDAKALRARRPIALVVGSAFSSWAKDIQRNVTSATLRLYTSPDPVGVELSNALAQVMTVALGIARTLGVGAATESTAMTRALAEADRLVRAFGGAPNTAYGLAGLGVLSTLVLEEAGMAWSAGAALAKGDLQTAQANQELVQMARTFAKRAKSGRIHAPMVQAIDKIFSGEVQAADALKALMSSDAGAE